MDLYRIIKPVKQVTNKNGTVVEGVWDIRAVPISSTHLEMTAVPTYESVANLDAGYKSKPEEGTTFLGEVVANVLYIIKYIDVHPRHAVEATSVPKYKAIAVSQDPGEFVFKTPAFNSLSLLRNGVIKLISGMGSFVFMDPYIPGRGILELLDRLVLTFKNFIMNLYGGSIKWTNFKEEEKWKSELAVDIYRGKSTDRNEDNKIEMRMGSLTEDPNSIMDIDINHTTADDKVFNIHQKFGDDGLTKEIEADKVTVTELTKPDSLQTIVKTEKLTMQEDKTANLYRITLDADGHEITFTINNNGLIINSNKRMAVTFEGDADITAKNITATASNDFIIDGKNVTVKGGNFFMKGSTVPPKTSGPLNSMIVCPFTGAPHAGDTVRGT